MDVLVLSTSALDPGVIADCRIVGVMAMEDDNGEDWKLLAVVHKDPRVASMGEGRNHTHARCPRWWRLRAATRASPAFSPYGSAFAA